MRGCLVVAAEPMTLVNNSSATLTQSSTLLQTFASYCSCNLHTAAYEFVAMSITYLQFCCRFTQQEARDAYKAAPLSHVVSTNQNYSQVNNIFQVCLCSGRGGSCGYINFTIYQQGISSQAVTCMQANSCCSCARTTCCVLCSSHNCSHSRW